MLGLGVMRRCGRECVRAQCGRAGEGDERVAAATADAGDVPAEVANVGAGGGSCGRRRWWWWWW